jgi:hypothetical protein
MGRFRSLILLATLAAAAHGVSAAESFGTITILEGTALIYRGVGRVQAQEGVRLALGDVIETDAATLAQFEMPDRSVMQIGPSTSVMIGGATVRGKPERWFYVINGWGKVSGTKRDARGGAAYDIRAPLIEIEAPAGVVVFRTTPTEAMVFVERGRARLVERQLRGAPAVSLKESDFYRRKGDRRGAVTSGIAADFVGSMPRTFRDAPPSRIDRYRDADVKPVEAPAFSYADVESWLKGEPAIRRQFMHRWRVKARDPKFRAELVANLPAHPEWDPILFPEKYLPKPTPSPTPWPRPPAQSVPGKVVTAPPAR